MKNIILIFMAIAISNILIAQTAQGTIKLGSASNSLIVAIKPSSNLSSSKISTFYFAIAIPNSTSPTPALSILTNFNLNIKYVIDSVAVDSINGFSYNVFNFHGEGSQATGVEKNYIAGIDNNMVEFSIVNGPADLSNIGIVSLPSGGSLQNSYFNIYDKGIDITNTTAMFYSSFALNSPEGYSGTSYQFLNSQMYSFVPRLISSAK